MPPTLFCPLKGNFLHSILCFCLNCDPPTYGLPRSWDHRDVPRPACLLRWGLPNVLPGLALKDDLPNLYLWSSSVYRYELPHPVWHGSIFYEYILIFWDHGMFSLY
jgi:hypothetical protein